MKLQVLESSLEIFSICLMIHDSAINCLRQTTKLVADFLLFVNMICNLFFHLDQREICLKESIPRCQNQPRADQMKTSTWQLRRHTFNRPPEKRRVLCVGLFCNMMFFLVQKENRMIGSLNVPLAIMPLSLPPALILNSDPRFNTVSCHHTASLHY